MNFLLLCIQSFVCCSVVYTVKKLGLISFRDFDTKDAKTWFPISVMLVGVIYTGSKSLVSTSIRSGKRRAHQMRLSGVLAILEHPSIHDLQESDYHPHRVRRSDLVWRSCDWAYPSVVHPNGMYELVKIDTAFSWLPGLPGRVFGHSGLGRHQRCIGSR